MILSLSPSSCHRPPQLRRRDTVGVLRGAYLLTPGCQLTKVRWSSMTVGLARPAFILASAVGPAIFDIMPKTSGASFLSACRSQLILAAPTGYALCLRQCSPLSIMNHPRAYARGIYKNLLKQALAVARELTPSHGLTPGVYCV